MLVKELWRGDERVFACKISKQMFGEKQYGNREAARRAALKCACGIIQEQRRNGVPAATSIRERRKLYRSCSRHPSSDVTSSQSTRSSFDEEFREEFDKC